MKKTGVIGSIILLWVSAALAGGIVTNTNQSAQFIRTLNRNASTCIDAVYFNPAGLTKLEDGFYLSLSNQSHFQTKEVTSATLDDKTFTGDVQALVFPNAYLAYKTGNLAFSAGFMPIGGGGSAEFADGLPSFEVPVAAMVPLLASQGVTGYQLDATFKGSSVYFGGQGCVSYKLNDMISVAVGGRYVSVSNSYTGHLKDIMINPGGTFMRADVFFTGAAAQYTSAATDASDAADLYELAGDLVTAAYYDHIADSLTTLAAGMTYNAAQTADKEVDAAQAGSGFTAIVGVNLSPMEGLNVGIRYEHLTKLEVENDTKIDETGMFPDGAKEQKDMPAMLAVGVAYQVMPALKTECSFNYYMNTGVDWDGDEENLENGFDGGLAVEYALSEALKASVGFLYANSGATDDYQTDLDYSLNSTSVAFGVGYVLSSNLELNLGALTSFSVEGQNTAATETYNKSTYGFAIGVNYRL